MSLRTRLIIWAFAGLTLFVVQGVFGVDGFDFYWWLAGLAILYPGLLEPAKSEALRKSIPER